MPLQSRQLDQALRRTSIYSIGPHSRYYLAEYYSRSPPNTGSSMTKRASGYRVGFFCTTIAELQRMSATGRSSDRGGAQRSCRPCRFSWRLTPSWSWRCRVRIGKSIWFRKGYCVLRLGLIRDETLIARPLGLLRMVNAASPGYLARYGVPRSLEDLQRQEPRTIHFSTKHAFPP
jgi:hypothetical protein